MCVLDSKNNNHSTQYITFPMYYLVCFAAVFISCSRTRLYHSAAYFCPWHVASGLQDSNISQSWKDIKEFSGFSCCGNLLSRLIGHEVPDKATLVLKLNKFLGSLMAHFCSLKPLSPAFGPVSVHLYVLERAVDKTHVR